MRAPLLTLATLMTAVLGGCLMPTEKDETQKNVLSASALIAGQSENAYVTVTWKQVAGPGSPNANTRGLKVKLAAYGVLGQFYPPIAWIIADGSVNGGAVRSNGIFFCSSESCHDASQNVNTDPKSSIAAEPGPNETAVHFISANTNTMYRLDTDTKKVTTEIWSGYNQVGAAYQGVSPFITDLWMTRASDNLLFQRVIGNGPGGFVMVNQHWYTKRVAVAKGLVPWIINNQDYVCTRPKGAVDFKCMDTRAKAIAVGRDPGNTVWMLSTEPAATAGDFALYYYDGSKWLRANGAGKELTVDEQGKPWVVNASGQLWQATAYATTNRAPVTASWSFVDGNVASDIGAGAYNAIWIAGNDIPAGGAHTFKKKTDVYPGWESSNGTGYRIDVGPEGPYVIGTDHRAYRAATTAGNWNPLGTETIGDIGVDKDGAAWALAWDNGSAGDHGLLRWKDNAWKPVTALRAVAIDVGPGGTPWAITATGDVFEGTADGSSWTQHMGPRAKDIGVGQDGSVYIISDIKVAGNGDCALFRYEAGGWTRIANGGGFRVSVDDGGYAWIVNSDGAVYKGM